MDAHLPRVGPCLLRFGEPLLRLTAEQLEALASEPVAVVGFYFDCDLRASGDVLLEDGRVVKLNGTIEGSRRVA